MNQVHGSRLAFVDREGGPGVVMAKTDGLWTDRQGVMLVVKTADCAPLLLWSEHAGVVAVLHCGWKGFKNGLIETFGQLCRDRKLDVSSFSAFIGPHLRREQFEVRQDFVDQLPPSRRRYLVRQEGGYRYDLTGGIVQTLQAAGISQIEDCGADTALNTDYFSYRAWNRLPESERPESYPTFASAIVVR